MPRRRDDTKNSEQVGLRMSSDLRERCNNARLSGAFKSSAEAAFMVYLIEIGLVKYEKVILPHEKDESFEVDAIKGGIDTVSKTA
jgi:hypothetical protein